MKSTVIYFSQTGNTRKVARAIQNAIKGVTEQCDIVKLNEADVNSLIGYDLIGLGCPTFSHKEPFNVSVFMRGMRPLMGKHCFIFATHAGHPSNVLPSMAGKIRRQGLKVIGGFNCDGSLCRPFFTSPWYTDRHPDDKDIQAAAGFACEMVELSQRIFRGEKVSMPMFNRLESGSPHGFHKIPRKNKPMSRGFEFKMTLDNKKCRYPKCQLCVDNCPVGAIDLSVDPIIFRRGCISCLFCEVICPTGAIEIHPDCVEPQRKRRMEIFRSRRYPEFFERAKTELFGNRSTLYRMLVDRVDLGNQDTMFGGIHAKRSRYVIRDHD
jgi:flavodoxin/ferredoxin